MCTDATFEATPANWYLIIEITHWLQISLESACSGAGAKRAHGRQLCPIQWTNFPHLTPCWPPDLPPALSGGPGMSISPRRAPLVVAKMSTSTMHAPSWSEPLPQPSHAAPNRVL